ncbi:tRNA uridine-5-carboxymethylaminomethyl(34) synthesis GTPase MnmE [Halpernia frigidisoli]|uniref:tRNA modification GTPase MnmE n=1 Tax=Halpernia frigidisoli TaxID=1125876 RepID=A0A1I3DLU4_9FLAO|nr:tRNA uridine-5-carboxymethylaminomethyl(34) synthesis GTPase MnmE [Halpernia frigidisoli]SFH87498.1 tRNA modification GTPase [Halpernia frigidisoli]
MNGNLNQDTICALATANGIGALGIIRLSGNEAVEIAQKCFKGSDLRTAKSHSVHYGFVVEKDINDERLLINDNAKIDHQSSTINDELIDEVMVSVFLAPKTFTTEDVVEISFHGSPHIAKKILEVLVKNGARLAKAGEFTMRAFMNGRIDLAQAESIADLIASENEAARKVALNQLKGGISKEISLLRGELLNFTSFLELELDFGEEDVEFADRTALNNLLDKIERKLKSLIESFQYGNAVKNGVEVAIIGKPNAGKSTLLNALLKEERAIVSAIAGTTRDTIEEVLHIKGNAFRFIDTAGLRETTDEIEKIGVQKAKEKIASAKILLYLYDEFDSSAEEVISFIKEFQRKDLKIILLHNKIDLNGGYFENELDTKIKSELFPDITNTIIGISAKDVESVEVLKTELSLYIEDLKDTESNVIVSNQRHYEALKSSLLAVDAVKEAIKSKIPTELLAFELRNVLENLGEISGEFTNDEVLGNIFSKFCIGK